MGSSTRRWTVLGAGVLAGLALVVLAAFLFWSRPAEQPQTPPDSAASSPSRFQGYAGTGSCRECHEKFYQLWAPSHHGLAMQAVTAKFLKANLQPPKAPITILDHRYQVLFRAGQAFVREQGPQRRKTYPLVQALGGKNVYYFLTPLDKGRLQVLPVAYDVRRQEWFDTTGSMVRHFGAAVRAEPVSWMDPLLTFNTACYSCHVSQLTTNYDLKTDTYHTVWAEPGINCETCHGPAAEHVRVCREAPKGSVPRDLKIIRGGRDFTVAQNNATCAPCHAKMIPLTASFQPGERFFDHYDLITLEDRDFYADGRDLGENFTYTLWRLSPCVNSGKLSCLHCHTSSGRYRFKDEAKANHACLPCHQPRVEQAAAHIHHPPDKPGVPTKCISCHMPLTAFARMRRTDHSLLPPTPGATLKFKSPNACNLCHQDKDAAWADQQVRKWRSRDYQAPLLYRAELLDAARKGDWTKLPEMLKYISTPEPNEIYAASLIRVLAFCPDPRKWPAIIGALKAKSPLVRAAAAAALESHLTSATREALLPCLADDYRLVRIRAAASLAPYPRELLNTADQQRLEAATRELLAALTARPDDWTSHYNLGNFYMARQEFAQALESFQAASRLQPRALLPWVNVSLVYARLGQREKAEKALHQALEIDPGNATANFNLGLILAEQHQSPAAAAAFRVALKTAPRFPEAAYNLGVLLAQDNLLEALEWCRKAHEWQPQNPKYAFTLAFYLRQQGHLPQALRVLAEQVRQKTANADVYFLLGDIYEKQGQPAAARKTYRQALAAAGLPPQAKNRLRARIRALTAEEKRP